MWYSQSCRYYSGTSSASHPRTSKYFPPQLVCRYFADNSINLYSRYNSCFTNSLINTTESSAFGTQRLWYFPINRLTATLEFPLDSSSKRCRSGHSINVCSTAVTESTETLWTPLRTVLTLVMSTCSWTIKWKNVNRLLVTQFHTKYELNQNSNIVCYWTFTLCNCLQKQFWIHANISSEWVWGQVSY
jgi:hypothetical protein